MPVTPPNFTQIPNEILDKMHEMTPAEFKVLVAICRKTFGWQKERDVISLSQLEEMTGLSRTAVQAGIMAGIERGMLERTKVGKQSYCYHLLVASDYQSTQATSSKKLPEPVVSDYQQLVASDYTQKKELNIRNKSGGGGARDASKSVVSNDAERDEVIVQMTVMFENPKQAKHLIAAVLKKQGRFTLADVEICRQWLAQQTMDRPLGKLNNLLEAGQLPTLRPSTPPLVVNGVRRGPAMSTAPDYDIHEAKRRGDEWRAKNGHLLPVGA